jgi:hypothetical protein
MICRVTKLVVWTKAYRPFIMGGDVNAPIACKVTVDGPHDLGNGVKVCLGVKPSGATFVAELSTGAIVGKSFQEVQNDMQESDPEAVRQQLAEAKERMKCCARLRPEEFWKLFDKPGRKS